MKYVDTKVVFREVPGEIALAINISGCPVGCPGCHSSYLAGDIGEVLDKESLGSLISRNPGITCVSFMGGDANPLYIKEVAGWVKSEYKGMKTCWYSGRGIEQAAPVLDVLDFVKVGPYSEEYGPLNKETTNQRFFRIVPSGTEDSVPSPVEGLAFLDWTYKFRPQTI